MKRKMERINLTGKDLPSYIGKKIQIKKGDEVFEGIVRGYGESVVSNSKGNATRPWLLETKFTSIQFVIDDWHIFS